MYYRRKVILSLLQIFDNKLDKISLQKLLMLYCDQQSKPVYQFVPYKFGCFSFQANADLSTLTKYGQVTEEEKFWLKTDNTNYIKELKESDRKALQLIKTTYEGKSKDELIRITYNEYPYYTINSTIADEVLSESELQNLESYRSTSDATIIFTIGYEGVSLEEYLNKLIINGITVLLDVRKNALSMKYGFCKTQLKNACEGVGIKYMHISALGIESDMRQELNDQSDYDKLFLQYRNEILTKTIKQQKYILGVLKKEKRIALTCFEANIHQCHRKHLAETIAQLPEFHYELKHI